MGKRDSAKHRDDEKDATDEFGDGGTMADHAKPNGGDDRLVENRTVNYGKQQPTSWGLLSTGRGPGQQGRWNCKGLWEKRRTVGMSPSCTVGL